MLKRVGGIFDIEVIRSKISEKEKITQEQNFWDEPKRAEKVMLEIKKLKGCIEPWETLAKDVDDLETLFLLAEEMKDSSLENEIKTSLEKNQEMYKTLNTLNLLSGEVDINDAYLTIHAGAGGTEACDWVSMLLRMYTRWAETRGFKIEIVDFTLGDVEGYKSITIEVKGEYAFGFLKGENGVHRLIRISPFDTNARRHTSFASIFVYPVLNDEINVEIRSEDLRIDTYRSGGAGGQHVNKTDSAVRITHLPTGIVVASQSERSQIINKNTAMNMLKARLYSYYEEQKEKENTKFMAEKKDISWGNQIRSYIFQPYTLVKDHRTKYESSNIQAVMDGKLDEFIVEYLNNKIKNNG